MEATPTPSLSTWNQSRADFSAVSSSGTSPSSSSTRKESRWQDSRLSMIPFLKLKTKSRNIFNWFSTCGNKNKINSHCVRVSHPCNWNDAAYLKQTLVFYLWHQIFKIFLLKVQNISFFFELNKQPGANLRKIIFQTLNLRFKTSAHSSRFFYYLF